MPEYRQLRDQLSFLEMCQRPEIAAEVTVTAVERLNADAAIIFADILLPLLPMGVGLRYAKGDGPLIDRPLRTAADLDRIPPIDVNESLGYVAEAIRLVRSVPRRSQAADRLRRRTLHPRVISDRGRRLAPISGDQNPDVHRARCLASHDGDDCRRHRRLPAHANRRRR